MKYTRYDYGKKKKDGTAIYVIVVIILSVLLGVTVFKVFTGYSLFQNFFKIENSSNKVNEEQVTTEYSISVIQCGVYGKKENADVALTQIPKAYQSFIYEEEGKYKVIAGIYLDNDLEKEKSELSSLSINNFKSTFNLTLDGIDGKVEWELIKGYIQIINKLADENVKSINTNEFKLWTNEIINKSENSNEKVKLLGENINSLPEEYEREHGKESLKFLYGIIEEYRK